jgi:hypothetical protein
VYIFKENENLTQRSIPWGVNLCIKKFGESSKKDAKSFRKSFLTYYFDVKNSCTASLICCSNTAVIHLTCHSLFCSPLVLMSADTTIQRLNGCWGWVSLVHVSRRHMDMNMNMISDILDFYDNGLAQFRN